MADEFADMIASQTAKVRAALNVNESSARIAGTTGESAILQSLVTLRVTETIDDTLKGLSERLTDVSASIDTIGASVTELKAAADSFAETTRESEEKLARWTRIQAWSTVVLAGFTLAQIVIAVACPNR